MTDSMIKYVKPLGFVWETGDPYLFCVHHQDAYPRGNGKMEPAASLAGRQIGQDFQLKDGWRMYHGHRVPGFPEHPHRGFETVTIVLEGFVDHFDSAGAAGRYGHGDVQWMTAGSGLQHAEMFPLVNEKQGNPLELFQIWLNLPKASKMVQPCYKMLWSEAIPVLQSKDTQGRAIQIRLIAGTFQGETAPAPAPDSWAAAPENQVAIWLITLAPHAEFTLPPATVNVNRTLYFFEGSSARINKTDVPGYHAALVSSQQALPLKNGPDQSRMLLLQGKPIAEPVAQYGPFVMNTQDEIQRTFEDYRQTRFGGWPWDRSDPVHPSTQGRFARYMDGSEEKKG
ncbi:MAG: pirin family protein [bacterium]